MKFFKWHKKSILTPVDMGCDTQALRIHWAIHNQRRPPELANNTSKNTIYYKPEHQLHHLDEDNPYEGSRSPNLKKRIN
jgi:hypothetical protein